MTEVLSFLRNSLNVLNQDSQASHSNIRRAKSAPAAPGRPASPPRSCLRGKNGPKSVRQSVRFTEGGAPNQANDDSEVGRSTMPKEPVGEQDEKVHEFDKLVRQLDEVQKGQLRECLVQKRFGKGETIIHSGVHGDSIFFIGFGSCLQLGSDGRSVELLAGDYFGEREALKTASREGQNILDSILQLHRERKVDVMAGESGCVVYECTGESFAAVFGSNKDLMAMIESRSRSRLHALNAKSLV